MTSEIIGSMVAGGIISAIFSSGVSFLFWAGVQRKVEQRDKDLNDLRGTVRALKDEKVADIEEKLDGSIVDNHEKHAGLHTKIEANAGQLHEKINQLDKRFVGLGECHQEHRHVEALLRKIEDTLTRNGNLLAELSEDMAGQKKEIEYISKNMQVQK